MHPFLWHPNHLNIGGYTPAIEFNAIFFVSFYVSVKCNKSQCIFQYFNYRFIKQIALLKSVPHLKFVELIFGKDHI